jgi:hypothetical protein
MQAQCVSSGNVVQRAAIVSTGDRYGMARNP